VIRDRTGPGDPLAEDRTRSAVTDDPALARLDAAVPRNVREVCDRLVRAGHEAVAVGGAVRDALLGRAPGDWDVATSAHPDEVLALFPRTIPTGLQHGTVTVVTGRGAESHVEVTTFRGEGAYTDARRPDHVTFGVPLVEDLARRDLRVNAMAYDPASRRLIDPFEGRRDIAERLLRAVGPTGNVYEDAVARFTEDGLRVMRAVRFAATLEFALDPDTERGIVPALPSLAKVSKERVCEELRRILGSREPSRALAAAERTGIIRVILPELDDAFGAWAAVRGDRAAAVAHWLARVDAAPPEARLGALLADLAPPAAAARLDRAAVKRTQDVLRRLKFSNEELAAASVLVGTAGAPLVPAWTDPELRRLLADVTRPHAAAAAALWRAAAAAQWHAGSTAGTARSAAAAGTAGTAGATALADRAAAILERRDPLAAGELAVAGKDLMAALGLAPGPALGRLLAALLDRALDDPSLNTRDRLLELARRLAPSLGGAPSS
jgi:tRNA nucleotidyltransferase (CCA-adding enzyme)